MSSVWPYQFISLSEDDKLHRRTLLDVRGQYAQWSIIFAILAIKTMRALTTINSSNLPKKPPSNWDRPLMPGWAETRRQYLVCGLWLSWLVTLSVWHSGEGMQWILFILCSASIKSANQYDRLSPSYQSPGSSWSVSTSTTSPNVSHGIHIIQTWIFVCSFCRLRHLSANFDTLPSSLWSAGHLASLVSSRYIVYAVLRAIQSPGVWKPVC